LNLENNYSSQAKKIEKEHLVFDAYHEKVLDAFRLSSEINYKKSLEKSCLYDTLTILGNYVDSIKHSLIERSMDATRSKHSPNEKKDRLSHVAEVEDRTSASKGKLKAAFSNIIPRKRKGHIEEVEGVVIPEVMKSTMSELFKLSVEYDFSEELEEKLKKVKDIPTHKHDTHHSRFNIFRTKAKK
jgi:hypothetical protein